MGIFRFKASERPLWAACAAAVLVPWTLGPGLRDAWVLPKCAAAGAFAAWGLAAWAAAGAPSLAVGLEAPVAAVLAAFCLAAVAAVDPLGAWLGPEFEPMAGVLGVFAAVAGLYLGVAAGRMRPGAARLFPRAVALAAAPMGVLAVVQVFSPDTSGWLGRGTGYLGRAVGTFGHPVAFGGYVALAVPYALSWAMVEEDRPSRSAAILCLVAVVAGLAAAGGRSAWLSAAAGCALVAWLEGRPFSRRAAAAAVAVGLVGLLLLSLRLVGVGQRQGGRLGAWAIAGGAFLERPVAGWGPGSFSLLYRRDRGAALVAEEGPAVVFSHAHNDWLEVLAATGLLGGAAYIWLHVSTASAARRVWGPAAAAGLGGAATLLVQAKLNFPPVPATFLGAAGLGAALSAAPAPAGGRIPAALLFALASLLALALPLSRFPAERADHLGRLAQSQGRPGVAVMAFEAAVAAAPGVVTFRSDLMSLLWALAEGAPPADRDELLSAARDTALRGARLRPTEPELARLLGVAELRRAASGAPSLPAARAALDAALAADPFNPAILESRRAVSALESQGSRRP